MQQSTQFDHCFLTEKEIQSLLTKKKLSYRDRQNIKHWVDNEPPLYMEHYRHPLKDPIISVISGLNGNHAVRFKYSRSFTTLMRTKKQISHSNVTLKKSSFSVPEFIEALKETKQNFGKDVVGNVDAFLQVMPLLKSKQCVVLSHINVRTRPHQTQRHSHKKMIMNRLHHMILQLCILQVCVVRTRNKD
eukprot:1136855_1